MRLRSNIIRATYAGRDILAPGGYLSAESYGGSRTFTTTTEPLLAAEAVTVRSHGNAQGSMSLPVCRDFASEPDALQAALDALDHAEQHAEGVLRLQIGETVRSWNAGVTGLQWQIGYAWASTESSSGCVRLTLTYEFVLGAALSENV